MAFPLRSNCIGSPFLLLFLLGYCLAVIEGELRCYCNESGCVSTGYMCKSTAGRCFTSVEVRGEVTRQTHGCLDSLPAPHRAHCRQLADVVQTSVQAEQRPPGGDHAPRDHAPSRPASLLLCCGEHMCNYREDLDVSIILTLNSSLHRGSAPSNTDTAVLRNSPDPRSSDRDLWFKAAVIAVPIAGGFILVLLVLLAVRMLKTDSRQHRRLIQIRRERSMTKAHMYITDHVVLGGDNGGLNGGVKATHCSLFNEATKTSTCVPVYSTSEAPSVCPVCCGADRAVNTTHAVNTTSHDVTCQQYSSPSDVVRDSCDTPLTTHQQQHTVSCSCGKSTSTSSSPLLAAYIGLHHAPCSPSLISDTINSSSPLCARSNKGDNNSKSNSSAPPKSFFITDTAVIAAGHDGHAPSVTSHSNGHAPNTVGHAHDMIVLSGRGSAGVSHSVSVTTWDKTCFKGPIANV